MVHLERVLYCALIMSSSSAGAFLMAPILSGILLLCLPQGRIEHIPKLGSLVFIEFIDAIPEAALFGEIASKGHISYTFMVSIFCFTIVSSTLMAIDGLAKYDSPILHEIIYVMIWFALGTLVYSIPGTIYANFEEDWDHDEKSMLDGFLLLGGTIFGVVIILAIESRKHKIEEESETAKLHPSVNNFWGETDSLLDKEPGSSSSCARQVKMVCFLVFLSMFSVSLSSGMSTLFWYLKKVNWLSSLLEGFSGGAFIATIAMVVIPGIAEELKATRWMKQPLKAQYIGAITFTLGMIATICVDVML